MNWENYWNTTATNKDHLAQVGRVNADPFKSIKQAALHIVELLDISKGDKVLDVCCGNGMITAEIASNCNSILGVDFSEKLIEQAIELHPGIEFEQQDATNLLLPKTFDKIYLAFSFQYFDSYEKGKLAINKFKHHARPGAKILLTDIPDKKKWGKFYNTIFKKLFYLKHRITRKYTMGKFWSEEELLKICNELGLEGTLISQPSSMPYSYYRFDFLIRVPN